MMPRMKGRAGSSPARSEDEERKSSVDEDAEEVCERAGDIWFFRSLKWRHVQAGGLTAWSASMEMPRRSMLSVLAEVQADRRLDGGIPPELRGMQTTTAFWLIAEESKE